MDEAILEGLGARLFLKSPPAVPEIGSNDAISIDFKAVTLWGNLLKNTIHNTDYKIANVGIEEQLLLVVRDLKTEVFYPTRSFDTYVIPEQLGRLSDYSKGLLLVLIL
ncbi:hypothetical protein DGG96_18080 [Legionella qingyii]|uniref:Uncharacterized protein n=1 Tax=Legionella qingyii TaxID=2184757 RepID=A0A317TXH8_9GAMM|nr:hypothetical protein DGG96_18080 [Legionella qingyii]